MRIKSIRPALPLLLYCLSSTLGAVAQSPAASSGTASNASPADRKFGQKAMQGGMAEVQLGQLAAQKASAEDVKRFGQQMVDDHTKLNAQMQQLAAIVRCHASIRPQPQ